MMKSSRLAPGLIALCLASIALPAPAGRLAEWSAKVDPRVVHDAATEGQAEFLIFLNEQAELTEIGRAARRDERGRRVFESLTGVAARTQGPLIAWLDAHGVDHRSYWIANMIWARADLDVIAAVAGRAEVRRLDANPVVHTPPPPPGSGTPSAVASIEWNIQQTAADQLWALGYTGAGVVVAGQDTGYEWDHPALKAQYRGWDGVSASHDYNWRDAIHGGGGDCGHDSPEPCDDIDHGTHTMGIMVGSDGGSNQIGMAPDARWIGCRNMKQGDGTPATYSECFQFFLAPTRIDGSDPDPARAPHVINNSWTCPTSEGCAHGTLQAIVNNVRAAGIVVVGAASNLGDDCSTIDEPPAIYDGVITAGATDSSDDIWQFSSRGPVTVDGSGRLKPDVSAPGVDIRSCIRDGDYDFISGTSMAGPHVVGMVALLLDARPDLAGQVNVIGELVTRSALPRTSNQNCGGMSGAVVPNPIYGHGRIDAMEMLFGDVDDDGTDNLNDCGPTDGAVWDAPAAATSLLLAKTATTELSWSAPVEPGGTATLYDLLRSESADDFALPTCVAAASGATSATDGATPSSLFFYLVRATNDCGTAVAAASDGWPRQAGVCSE